MAVVVLCLLSVLLGSTSALNTCTHFDGLHQRSVGRCVSDGEDSVPTTVAVIHCPPVSDSYTERRHAPILDVLPLSPLLLPSASTARPSVGSSLATAAAAASEENLAVLSLPLSHFSHLLPSFHRHRSQTDRTLSGASPRHSQRR